MLLTLVIAFRMGVALALARHGDTGIARAAARTAAAKVKIDYQA
jgi:hypothetical protein